MKTNEEKFKNLARRVYKNACEHGFHDKRLSAGHHLCMIMTEVAEAVEADRRGHRANVKAFTELQRRGTGFTGDFGIFIKSSLEDEFADICIRIFDFAYERYGEDMMWLNFDTIRICKGWSFTETAHYFLFRILGTSTIRLSAAILFMYEWAKILDIDLDWHIEMKMKYNESRTMKHGKKY